MRKFFAVLILLSFVCSSYAEETYTKKYKGYPQGTFKKAKNGSIVQYDKNGKKVGVYKNYTRKYVK